MNLLSIIQQVEDGVSDTRSHYRQKEFNSAWEQLRYITDFLLRHVGTTDNPGHGKAGEDAR